MNNCKTECESCSLLCRAELVMDESTENANLRINEIRTTDEGEYKCEITFLDITKNCPVVQLVKLTTLGKYNVGLLKHFHSFSMGTDNQPTNPLEDVLCNFLQKLKFPNRKTAAETR